jgi:hypothetical protein
MQHSLLLRAVKKAISSIKEGVKNSYYFKSARQKFPYWGR